MSAAIISPAAMPAISLRPRRFGRQLAEATFGLLLSVVQFAVASTFLVNAVVGLPSLSHLPSLSDVVGGTLLILLPTLVISLFFAVVLGLPASLALAQLDRARIGLVGLGTAHYLAGWLIGGVVLGLIGGTFQLGIIKLVAGGDAIPDVVPNLVILALCAHFFGFSAAFGALMSRLTFDHLAARKAAVA